MSSSSRDATSASSRAPQPLDASAVAPTPSLLRVVSHANRLLAFKPPARRLREAHERLAGPSVCQQLPPAERDRLCQRLWRQALRLPPDAAPCPEDVLITLSLLAEDAWQFDLQAWLARDLAELANGGPQTAMHGGRYHPERMDAPSLKAVLEAHDYDARPLGWFDDPALGWRAARDLNAPMPWSALLDALDAHQTGENPLSLDPFPMLARLKRRRARVGSPSSALPASGDAKGWQSLWERLRAVAAENDEAGPVRPVRGLILAEGETESLVIPAFARALGVSTTACGILALGAGGRKPAASRYPEYAEILAGPIVALLDDDARDSVEAIRAALRPQDAVITLAEGEMEDAYPLPLLLRTINAGFLPSHPVTIDDWDALQRAWQAERGRPPRTVETLQMLWKREGLCGGAFDKTRFARAIAETVSGPQDAPKGVREALKALGAL